MNPPLTDALFPEDERFLARLLASWRRRARLPVVVVVPPPGGRPQPVPLHLPLRPYLPLRPEPASFAHFEEATHRSMERHGIRLPEGRPGIWLLAAACREEEPFPRRGFVIDGGIAGIDAIVVDLDRGRVPPDGPRMNDGRDPDAVVAALETAGLPQPTAILAAGDDWQLVWLLRRRLAVGGRRDPEAAATVCRFHERVLGTLRDFGANRDGSWPLPPLRPLPVPPPLFRLPLSWNRRDGCVVHVVWNGPLLDHARLHRTASGNRHR